MKPYLKEFIEYIREQVKAGKPKYRVARELGISDTTVYVHTTDLPSRPQPKRLSKETIAKIKEEVLKGKPKRKVARELGLYDSTVYYHTKDIRMYRFHGPHIEGEELELLKKLLQNGFVYTAKHRNTLRSLQKHFPVIKRSQFKNRSIYYLEDKNKLALQEMMKQNNKRIFSYQELGRLTQVFDVDISSKEKNVFFGKNKKFNRRKNNKIKQIKRSISKEKQSKIEDFLGRFLHSEVLRWFCKESVFLIQKTTRNVI